jgi:protein SCO1
MLTSKLALIANLLPYELGKKVTLVSITLDPEHDHPAQLLDYTRSHGANREGWLFLTGSPVQIEQVLAAYSLRRKREADGSVTHMTSVFLLGPDGHQMRIYNGLEAKPTTVTADILRTLG